jgi:hypothetical protein
MKNFYVCGIVIDQATFELVEYEDDNGDPILENLALILAPGSIGVLPIFTNKKQADAYSKKNDAKTYKLRGDLLL